MQPILRVLVAVLCCAQLGLSQTDLWERVQLIEKGKGISVTLASGKTVSGKMDEWQANSLVVRQRKTKTVTVARADVAKVYLTAGMSRGRRALWAFGIGTAAGVGLYGAVVGAGDVDTEAAGAVIIGGGLFIGGIAAGIAALIPQHKELIFSGAPQATK